MEQKTLSAVKRTELKKGASARLRRCGMIPAVVYGGKSGNSTISLNEHEFVTKFATISENTLIKLDLGSESREVLVKDFLKETLSGKIMHVDFYEVTDDRVLKARVPIHLSGTPKGVREGGILEISLHEIEVECLPRDLPTSIDYDISGLESNHALHVRDLPTFANVRFLGNPDQVVAGIAHAKVEAAPAAEAATAEAEAAVADGKEQEKGR